MAEMWYYTSEGKQMDAVPIRELKKLVGEGLLKPTDMVWKEGMARWIRASSVAELFPDPSAALDQYFTSGGAKEGEKGNPQLTSIAAAAKPAAVPAPMASSTPAPAPDEEEPRERKKRKSFDEDDRRRPPRRRSEPSSGGSNLGIIIALLLGGGVLVAALAVGVIILVIAIRPGADAPMKPVVVPQGAHSYQLALNGSGSDTRTFQFRKGIAYHITVQTEQRHADVDLFISRAAGGQEAADDGPSADCSVRWTPREDGEYRVEVRNLDFDRVNSTVIINPAPSADKAKPPDPDPLEQKEPPLPEGTKTGENIFDIQLGAGANQTFKFRVKGGHPAQFSVTAGKKTKANIDIVVNSDADGRLIASDKKPGQKASVSFVVPQTELVTLRVENKSRAFGLRCTVIYNVGK